MVDHYRKCLTSDIIMPLEDNEDFKSSWHLCSIRVPKQRDELSVYLKEKNINTGVHYKPIHTYKCYGNSPTLPNAETVFKNLITLPLYPELNFKQVEYISKNVNDFFS